ncbi:hypothetical protein K227x_49080 [Rubripirellula lacrimiformis]|uniref:Uncharacterized protein n=1 Tax=Rubripirellula lacrimiformis TaxID=1930273 RepID=A0A517NHE5_9BACT|nr:DUF6702 family protein [Rubripirellula lacrimiformis]QDT06498.1 hypothetical protein K227x_49080 [Rubripirellula lacrimiformis]
MTSALLWMMLVMHPVHETVAEVEWNPQTKRLEVALRLDVDDERWIADKMAARAEADGIPWDRSKTSTWAMAYLQPRFRAAPLPASGKSDSTRYHWIGHDQDGAHVWWYFEIEPADGKPVQWIDQRLLFDREPDFLHRILVLNQTQTPGSSKIKSPQRSDSASVPKSDSQRSTASRAADLTIGRSKFFLDGSDGPSRSGPSDSNHSNSPEPSTDDDDAPLPPTDL